MLFFHWVERTKKISTSQHHILKGGMQEGDVYCGASSAILHQTFEIFFLQMIGQACQSVNCPTFTQLTFPKFCRGSQVSIMYSALKMATKV